MPESTRSSTSIFRKILLLVFVIGVWILFYWYQDIEQSKIKPVPTPDTQTESFTKKN